MHQCQYRATNSQHLCRRGRKEDFNGDIFLNYRYNSLPLFMLITLPSHRHNVIVACRQERPRTSGDDRPIISFDEFQALFQQVLKDGKISCHCCIDQCWLHCILCANGV